MVEHTLGASPSLLSSYARAVAAGPLHRLKPRHGVGTLPDSIYLLEDQTIDLAHLTAYERVCGFPVSDVVPVTYLHTLAFPLSMALMTDHAFPFPLVGLVHIANSITSTRPVTAAEPVSLRVRAADLRTHPAGTQFDLLAEASAGGDIVWRSRSTYLRRGKAPAGTERPPREGRRDLEPQRGPVVRVRAPGDIGRRYAAVSGDRNPIHLHPLSARLFGFPGAIAHGMWLTARTLATLEGRLPTASTVDVAFKLPVLLPSTMAVAAYDDGHGTWDLDVRDARSGKPHLTGRVQPVAS